MFDRHYHIQDEHSRVEAARINAMSQEKFAKQLKDISEAEIKSKDRVDITLEEYERLKNENSNLIYENQKLRIMFERIGIPIEVILNVIPDSVEVLTCFNINFRDNTQKYRVQFDIPRECLKG